MYSTQSRVQQSKMADDSTQQHVYLPGDVVKLRKEEESSQDKVFLGPGLRKYGKDILVTKCGVLRRKTQPLTYWIDCHQKRVSHRRNFELYSFSTIFCHYSMFQLGAIMSLVLSQTNLVIPTSCTLDLTKRPHCLPLPFRVPQRKTNLIYRYIHEHAKFLNC
jgi:hypothetical protein